MTRLLLIIATISMFFSCKKHDVGPAPQPPTNNSPVNYLPKMVISSSSFTLAKIVSTFSYYPNNLVKSITKTNIYTSPLSNDSTTFIYNSNNLVSNKKNYTNNIITEDIDITYTSTGKIDHVKDQLSGSLIEYTYHYTVADEVDYILTYQDGNSQATDSVTVNGNLFTNYVYMLNDTPNSPAPNGFVTTGTEYHYASPNGVHEQIPTCLNLSIGFQTELAESFLEMGETNFPNRNYFSIPLPRQYCSSVNAQIYTYTFDNNNRLIKIFQEVTNSATPGFVQGDQTSQIYY